MSFAQRLWSSTGSADRPMILALRLSNSAFIFAMVPSSVVHTGVKSLGCENRIAHLSPIHWWKSIWPSVVCAWKFGAVSPIRSDIGGWLALYWGDGNPTAPRPFPLPGLWSRVGPDLFGVQTNAAQRP